jgi:hypothetical protein
LFLFRVGNRLKAGRLRVGQARARAANRHGNGSSPTHGGTGSENSGSISNGSQLEKSKRLGVNMGESHDESPSNTQRIHGAVVAVRGAYTGNSYHSTQSSDRTATLRFSTDRAHGSGPGTAPASTGDRLSEKRYAPVTTTDETMYTDGALGGTLVHSSIPERGDEDDHSPKGQGPNGIEMV